ncbi:NYN domain-containing protein [Paragemmobacter straminiformis]|uniref:NYN domain-containing protein n=1 Tax=Paragemmobacter straminiformis TaxID=2045119 RepID=A0A842I6K7_9RHOB|nr:NYN domain-containing protein [Gemmobacter straminiformis]MBC2835043.1 NYN domain-containing protein [Gemmobacter straminiformis]
MTRRVAVLVDGDNVPPSKAARIVAEAERIGRIDVSRVYGAVSRTPGWDAAAGFRMMHAGAGKNGADLLLTIDAMELALLGGFEDFVLATSDRDLSHLALRLRERGCHVLGIGEAKATADFRAACSRFVVFPDEAPVRADAPVAVVPVVPKPAPKPAPPKVAPPKAVAAPVAGPAAGDLDLKIRDMIAKYSTGGKGIKLTELAPKMHQTHRVMISTYPERTWRAYLIKRPNLYEVDPRGAEAMVRFRPAGFGPWEAAG